MRTYIKTLTTDDRYRDFNKVAYDQFSLHEQSIHLVRQCWGMKYLKLIYGDDLWFLFKAYHQDLETELNLFKDKIKSYGHDGFVQGACTRAAIICNNALKDPVVSIPLGITEDDFMLSFSFPQKSGGDHRDKIPVFGTPHFALTLFAHLRNMVLPMESRGKALSREFKGSLLVPYNPLNSISSWREMKGGDYEYDVEVVKHNCTKVGLDPALLSPFLQLLVSIKRTPYLEAPESLLAMLATFMIDPTYITDYCGYINAMTGTEDTGQSKKTPSVNSIIYKGCYRVLFDELNNSVFKTLNTQCKVVIADKNSGFTKPVVDNHCAKNLLWLLCYITEKADVGFKNNAILTKLITYFEPKILPANIPKFLTILHKVPDLSLAEQNLLLSSGFGSLFSASGSPFSTEADEVTDDESQDDEEKKSSDDTEETEELPDIEDGGIDPDATDSDTDGGTEDSEEGGDTDDSGEVESSDDQQVLPEYLLELGAPPDLDNVLYRMELDRNITLILKSPPKNMPGEDIKTLQYLQTYWLHIISLPTLKLIINSLIKKG